MSERSWPLTDEEVERWLGEQTWKVAVTAPHNPHSYALRHECDDPVMFQRVVLHIREHGYIYRWGSGHYIQYRAGGYDCWTMGNALEATILINRKSTEQAERDEAEGKAGCGPIDPSARPAAREES